MENSKLDPEEVFKHSPDLKRTHDAFMARTWATIEDAHFVSMEMAKMVIDLHLLNEGAGHD